MDEFKPIVETVREKGYGNSLSLRLSTPKTRFECRVLAWVAVMGVRLTGNSWDPVYYGLELIEVIHVGHCMVRKVTGMLRRGVIGGSILQTTIAQTHRIAIESKRLQKRLKKILRIVPKCLRGW